jgi:hypothetical protein
MKKLYLDDFRFPKLSFDYTNNIIYNDKDWDIVTNYDEFVNYILKNGLPNLISFDHDLADEHYTPAIYWNDYEKSKEYQEKLQYKEKTGLECAKWLIDYCIDNKQKLPNYLCHSQNPVGKDNILGLLDNFNKNENI